jgi:hypothetical protein
VQQPHKTFFFAAASCSDHTKRFFLLLQIAATTQNVFFCCCKLQRPRKTFFFAAANCSDYAKRFFLLLHCALFVKDTKTEQQIDSFIKNHIHFLQKQKMDMVFFICSTRTQVFFYKNKQSAKETQVRVV